MSLIDVQDDRALLDDEQDAAPAAAIACPPRDPGRAGRAERLILGTVRWIFLPAALILTVGIALRPITARNLPGIMVNRLGQLLPRPSCRTRLRRPHPPGGRT